MVRRGARREKGVVDAGGKRVKRRVERWRSMVEGGGGGRMGCLWWRMGLEQVWMLRGNGAEGVFFKGDDGVEELMHDSVASSL